jgi:hypothetical protein
MVGYARRSWNLATITCQDLGWTLDTSMQLALEIGWGITRSIKVSFDLTITFYVPPFSHNVATKWNMIASWILEMANVIVKNNVA